MEPATASHTPVDEARGWALLAVDVVDGLLVRTVHQFHRAVGDRMLGALGPVAEPVRKAHETVFEGVHFTVRASVKGMGLVGAAVAAELARKHDRPWHDRSAMGSKLAAIAHGLIGDLPSIAPSLDLPLTLREGGHNVLVEPEELAAAFPDAQDKVAVFLHGLVEDETVWDAAAEKPGRTCLPDTFEAHGFTPVRIRYGTGTPIGRNGGVLDALLEDLVLGWPRPVKQLVIVGHSMGGLVARSACLFAAERGHTWTAPLEHIAYLGAPHFGSTLEQVVYRASERFGQVPEVAPFIAILERRSPGIRDLRDGTLTEQVDDLLDAIEPALDDPWLEGVVHHLVVGRLHPKERHPVNRFFGDLLVSPQSASGRSQERQIDGEHVHIVSVPANHFGMCWHPGVADHLVHHVIGATPTAA